MSRRRARYAPEYRRPMGAPEHRERANLEPLRIGRPGVHNHPPGKPPTLAFDKDPLPSAIVHHRSAGDESYQPSTESEQLQVEWSGRRR